MQAGQADRGYPQVEFGGSACSLAVRRGGQTDPSSALAAGEGAAILHRQRPGPVGGSREQGECAELALLLEGAAHRGERAGIAQAQRGEALTERGDLDQARRGGGRLHAALQAPSVACGEGSCVTPSARISAESVVTTCTCEPRVTRDSDRLSARLRRSARGLLGDRAQATSSRTARRPSCARRTIGTSSSSSTPARSRCTDHLRLQRDCGATPALTAPCRGAILAGHSADVTRDLQTISPCLIATRRQRGALSSTKPTNPGNPGDATGAWATDAPLVRSP